LLLGARINVSNAGRVHVNSIWCLAGGKCRGRELQFHTRRRQSGEGSRRRPRRMQLEIEARLVRSETGQGLAGCASKRSCREPLPDPLIIRHHSPQRPPMVHSQLGSRDLHSRFLAPQQSCPGLPLDGRATAVAALDATQRFVTAAAATLPYRVPKLASVPSPPSIHVLIYGPSPAWQTLHSWSSAGRTESLPYPPSLPAESLGIPSFAS
jgi:hypothetical protein